MFSFDLYDFYAKGGVFMHLILLCSIISLAIVLERAWVLRQNRVIPAGLGPMVERCVREGEILAAIDLCQSNGSAMARILMAGLKNAGKKRENLTVLIEEVGKREAKSMVRYLEGLSTIASVSTLLGLLGTIAGMISIFGVISMEPVVNPTVLAGGISQALNTTAFGIAVAIPTTVFYKFLLGKAERMIAEMEETSLHVADLLKSEEG